MTKMVTNVPKRVIFILWEGFVIVPSSTKNVVTPLGLPHTPDTPERRGLLDN